jgi:hypothetical protein
MVSVKNLDRSWVLTLQIPLSRQTLLIKGSVTALGMVSESVPEPVGSEILDDNSVVDLHAYLEERSLHEGCGATDLAVII